MTEQHTQPVDNSETATDSAVVMPEHTTDSTEPANKLDLPVMPTDASKLSDSTDPDDQDDETEPASELESDDLEDLQDADLDETAEVTDPDVLPALVEALLFVADQPIDANTLGRALEVTPLRARRALDHLTKSLRDDERGLRLQVGPDGAQLVTAPEAAAVVEHFLGLEASRRLSNAALETLAIVAYRQPVTRYLVDQIRGVDSGGALATLRARNLIEAVGRAPAPGRPTLFSTTQRFLEHFGLERAQDLPSLPDDVELSPEDAGTQLAFDQTINTEANHDAEHALEPACTDLSEANVDELETAAQVFEDDLEETVFDVEDKDVEISSDLGDLSRAAGAAFGGANEAPDSSGD